MLEGAEYATVAVVVPDAVAVPIIGVPGTLFERVNPAEAVDGELLPALVIAVTLNKYVNPVAIPRTDAVVAAETPSE